MPIDASSIDAALVERVLAGDPQAGDDLVEACRPLILGLAHGRFGLDRETAEEVAQAVVVRLWQDDYRALRAWRREGKFTTYLTVIVARLCLAARRRRERPAGGDEPAQAPPSTEPPASPETMVSSQQRDAALHSAISALSTRDRLLIRLRFGDGRAPTEIARLLGLEPGTARKALHDALRRLRRRLESAGAAGKAASGDTDA